MTPEVLRSRGASGLRSACQNFMPGKYSPKRGLITICGRSPLVHWLSKRWESSLETTFPHSTRPPPSSASRASRTRRINSVRLISAMSRLTSSTLKNSTKVALLMLAKVSHKACSTTAVKKAPRTRQSRVACPTLSLSPQDSTYKPRPSHVTGRRGQAAHQEYLIQDPEVALGGEQGGEPVAHCLQTREACRGSNTQDYPCRLRSVAPHEVEDEGHDQLGRLLYETDEQLGQK